MNLSGGAWGNPNRDKDPGTEYGSPPQLNSVAKIRQEQLDLKFRCPLDFRFGVPIDERRVHPGILEFARRERIHGILELLKSLTVGQLDLKFQRTLHAGINGQARPKADTTKACATPTLDADSQIALGIGHD